MPSSERSTDARDSAGEVTVPAFVTGGARLEVGGDRPLALDGGGAWFLEAGSLDVFRVTARGGVAGGSRHHLFRASAGALVIAFEVVPDELTMLAVPTRGTVVWRIEAAMLATALEDSARHEEVAPLLDGWVRALSESMTEGVPPTDCVDLEPSKRRYRDVSRLGPTMPLWLSVPGKSARPTLLDDDELTLAPEGLAVAAPMWLTVPADGALVAESTVEALVRGDVPARLAQLHTLYFAAVGKAVARTDEAERARLERKAAADRRSLENALRDVAVTLDPRLGEQVAHAAVPEEEADQLLLDACTRVGKACGVRVEAPRRDPGQTTKLTLAAVARASRFHTRRILLRDGWWDNDSGPLLGVLEGPHRPVALLPDRRGGYRLHDPVAGRPVTVTAEVAETLVPHAFTFYRPFAERPIGIRDLLRFAAESSGRDLLLFVLMSAAASVLSLLTPLVTRVIFNDIIPGAARDELLQVTLILVVIALATAVFNTAGALALVRVEGKSGAAILAAVWDRLLSLPVPFFRPYTAGNLASRAMGIETMRRVLSGDAIQSLVTAVFSMLHVGLLFYFSSRLAWWAVLLIAIAFAMTLTVGHLQTIAERRVNAVRNKLAGTVLQLLSSIAKLRVAGAEVQAFCQWAHSFSEQRRYQLRSRSRANILFAFNAGFPVIANLVIFAFAYQDLMVEKTLRTGDFLAFVASFTMALSGVLGAGRAITLAASVVPLFEDARPILGSLPEADAAKASPGALTGSIEVHHLSFRYQDDGPTVLQDVSVRARPGEFVALVGPSGSGKSTLLRLLLGFEKPLSGSVFYDGQDLDGLDYGAVRSQIGVVLQNARLMSGDIFSNIIGSSQATVDDAWVAARMAGLEADIKAMPMGMHTLLTEGGGTLSGGQRQRLMIARAMLKRPRMLFFDEATSALDNRTQAIVTESLDGLQATRIVVAHRLSTIQNADRIVVLEQGKVTEEGTFTELMDRGGTFRALAERQMT